MELVGRAGASPPSRTAAIIFLIGRAGASPPSLTTGAPPSIFIYIVCPTDRPRPPAPDGPALRANVAGQITRASTLYVFIHVYICVYTWSKLASLL